MFGVAAGLTMLAGCGQPTAGVAVPQKSDASTTADSQQAHSDPAQAARQVSERYAQLAAEMLNSRGETLAGQPATSEADVRGAFDFVCEQQQKGLVAQWSELDENRKRTPDIKNPIWEGVGSIRAVVSEVHVQGDSGTFSMQVSSDTNTPKKGTLALQKTGDQWQVCTSPAK